MIKNGVGYLERYRFYCIFIIIGLFKIVCENKKKMLRCYKIDVIVNLRVKKVILKWRKEK